jgi:hypothetical protein
MAKPLRALARRLLGVARVPTYYLPWLTRPSLECALVLHNVEARFKPGFNEGPFPLTVVQHDADGRVVRRYEVALRDSTDRVELPLEPTPAGCGIVTVTGERLHSDLYVTLSDGHEYTATHGRGEFVEHYPWWARAAMGALGTALAGSGRTIPAFARDQYCYLGPDHRSHLLLMNLSNTVNRIRVVAIRSGLAVGASLVSLPPMGARLLDVASFATGADTGTTVWRLRIDGNAWFNLYLVGAGPRDLAGPLSLMHVK